MKAWRESTSLIIAAKNGINFNNTYNYNLLFLKRSERIKFSGAFVFPGGNFEKADADLKWEKLFLSQGCTDNSFKSLYPTSKDRPDIFTKKQNEISREISLRISTIRETFEECGILLCKKSSDSTDSSLSHPLKISNNELEYWQNKVHNDANEFYNMCEKLDCHPNLWALHEWGNWLTPTFFPKKFRHNTAFFFTYLPNIPKIKIETFEVEEFMWATPDHMITKFRNFLLPPQQYELSELLKYKNIEDLIKFATDRSKKGVDQYLSVRVILQDGAVQLLPGDSMYPDKVDLYKKEYIDKSNMTIKEFRDISPKRHRIEIFDDSDSKDNIYSKL